METDGNIDTERKLLIQQLYGRREVGRVRRQRRLDGEVEESHVHNWKLVNYMRSLLRA